MSAFVYSHGGSPFVVAGVLLSVLRLFVSGPLVGGIARRKCLDALKRQLHASAANPDKVVLLAQMLWAAEYHEVSFARPCRVNSGVKEFELNPKNRLNCFPTAKQEFHFEFIDGFCGGFCN